jgi:hypothetical protein
MTNKEVIYELEMMKRMIKADSWADKALDIAIKALEERPQGEWEFFSIGNNQYSRCSVCKDEHTSEYTDLDWWYDNFKYCPNCGAYMVREAHNDE